MAVAPLREKIRDLEQSFSQKYPPVKFLSEKDRKRILITGGAGFVGSHLTDKLMMDGHEVTVVDNFFTGRKRNVEHWIGHENFELINHDVVEPLYIEVDQIYHLASPASPPNYMYNPIKTLKTNTIGTLNMLDPEVHPQNEEYWGHVNPIGPRACYDEGKRVAETMCYSYMKQEGVEVRVARIFNTFGSRMHMNDGRVVSNFILQALQGEPLTVYGTGSQTRAFQYVRGKRYKQSVAQKFVRILRGEYSTFRVFVEPSLPVGLIIVRYEAHYMVVSSANFFTMVFVEWMAEQSLVKRVKRAGLSTRTALWCACAQDQCRGCVVPRFSPPEACW
ncbi:hypothetical protein L3Q82_004397 [Scortum barcoo]|uniref:Uncharacterized protein n=1 Tax=Scortum barcoo TaxID=214431 RepID=A0ACB8VJZ3_9TELE|nr:hypothetical protein L3Q82_004397 [Scortum barcoo]